MTSRNPPDRTDLLQSIRACTACEALPLGPRPILQWSPKAPILIAGQAPGRITHAKGIPFDDPSGNRLRDWLGVTRDQFYDPELFAIVPMAFCFPGSGKTGDLPPPPRCAELWRERLMGGLKGLQLTIIIGQFASAWHLPSDKRSLTDQAGDWQAMLPTQIVLPHPSPRNQRWLARNPWFAEEVIPALRSHVSTLLDPAK